MTSEIREYISTCSICRTYESANQRETLMSHDIPDRPWAKVGTDLCQHAAFTRPIAISAEQISPAEIEKVGKMARELATEDGKPEQIIEKIVEGKIRAFCKQNALLDQEHVKPDYEKKSVQAVLKAAGVGTVTDLAVFQVGGA